MHQIQFEYINLNIFLQEDSGCPLIYEKVLVGIVIFRRKIQNQIPPVTFMRLNDIGELFPEMHYKPIPENHVLKLIMCKP